MDSWSLKNFYQIFSRCRMFKECLALAPSDFPWQPYVCNKDQR